jgi:hypothetical protein
MECSDQVDSEIECFCLKIRSIFSGKLWVMADSRHGVGRRIETWDRSRFIVIVFIKEVELI